LSALHLIKLCVGCDTPEALAAWRAERRAQGFAPLVHTRQTPKRAAEMLGGGSLYWVFKGMILARQPIRGVETLGEGAQKRCEILLDDALIRTEPQPRRAFQGWRYLEAKDAPADLAQDGSGQAMPSALVKELKELGAW
jgi:hypothetical protein